MSCECRIVSTGFDGLATSTQPYVEYCLLHKAAPELHKLLCLIAKGYHYDPGSSDLDDEQPIAVWMTLGDYRRIVRMLAKAEGRKP
jgi:hypothetical protein